MKNSGGTALGILAVLSLGGCSFSPSAHSTPAATASPDAGAAKPSPSASPSSGSVLVFADPRYPAPNQSTVITLVDLKGSERSVTLDLGSKLMGVAGSRAFILDTSGRLRALHRDGSFELLGTLPPHTEPWTFLASPDGTRWAWSTAIYPTPGVAGPIQSQIQVAGTAGAEPLVVEYANETQRTLQPYQWDSNGLLVMHGAVGIGGYIPFSAASGPVDRVDPVKGTITPLREVSGCPFSDVAADGTVACLALDTTRVPSRGIQIVSPGGSARTVDAPRPTFNLFGDAFFSPDGGFLLMGGALGQSDNEVFQTAAIRVGDGQMLPLGPAGLRPALGKRSWLPDGRVVLTHPDYSKGEVKGTYVGIPGGNVTKVTDRSSPAGIFF